MPSVSHKPLHEPARNSRGRVSPAGREVVRVVDSSMTLCSLSVGATFGESVLHDLPREGTVVTRSTCELLRVDQSDFKLIWEVSGPEGLQVDQRDYKVILEISGAERLQGHLWRLVEQRDYKVILEVSGTEGLQGHLGGEWNRGIARSSWRSSWRLVEQRDYKVILEVSRTEGLQGHLGGLGAGRTKSPPQVAQSPHLHHSPSRPQVCEPPDPMGPIVEVSILGRPHTSQRVTCWLRLWLKSWSVIIHTVSMVGSNV
uniref:Cyclic nucleotide-binding domain-containing protein n=1 Tax=Timema genevievae TaxID=629358 RepID=A0A7R9PKQ9_TIMGE|nr:unnamed protein product [Timema genevievae]